MRMEAECSSETLESIYNATMCHIPSDYNHNRLGQFSHKVIVNVCIKLIRLVEILTILAEATNSPKCLHGILLN
jgi:hypothetical protein